MGIVSSWITNIILLILFATILELILPNSSTHRYVKLVVGLMLLVAMLQPVLSIFQEDPEELLKQMDSWGGDSYETEMNINELEKTDIESESLAYISEQVAVQLRGKAQTVLINEFEKEITDLTVSFLSLHEQDDLDNLDSIEVIISDASLQRNETDPPEEEIHIEPIVIETNTTPGSQEENTEGNSLMRSRLSELWEVPEEVIFIREEGGGTSE
ncbi:stage III sporulation protein AF [Salipaludibacillus keqinensis]|uniref:stage III sporulation protein AF n=1 Tax=Salipaludibacillus keqinensis TaxID=2045207 RepID=UPI001304BCBF|nr:stage III sporulation protein AF [Salipaludibacillus keqinensis]